MGTEDHPDGSEARRGDRHRVADIEDFDRGSRIITEIKGRSIAIFERGESYYGVLNFCVHQAGPLCEGGIEGRMELGEDGWNWEYVDDGRYITCPWHAWKFDIETGEHLDDDRYSVPTFEVEQEGDGIFVYL